MNTRYKKKGTPRREVIIPTGISMGIMISRAAVSEHKSKRAPTSALQGKRNLWSLPTSMREMWGAVKPTKPITPMNATTLAVDKVDKTIEMMITRLEFTPILVATSSPRVITFRFQD